MYQNDKQKPFRPNTKKLYEEHHNVVIPDDYEVHHILPIRLGGTHEISNLTVLHKVDHAEAHLELYRLYGDPKDLCAYHMIGGRDEEAHLVACSTGGKASQAAKRERGEANGFQLFPVERRKKIASKAGSIGGTRQRDLGIGIHVDKETRSEWARLGAEAVKEKFTDPCVQSSRGKRGGVKNKGFRWCHDASGNMIKYTTAQQETESFEDFVRRNGLKPGRPTSPDLGGRFYNDGEKQWVFRQSDHAESFEEFLAKHNYKQGRLK